MITVYSILIFFHILLFVFWLGGDLGVAILGDHFRKRTYSLEERMTILKILVINDLGPRYAWALMVASTMSLVSAGGYWPLPIWAVGLSWAVSLLWVWLVMAIHREGQSSRGAQLRKIEFYLKWALASFYLGLGAVSLAIDAPLAPNWLASKALIFGLVFSAAIMIDVKFKPVGPALLKLLDEGSTDETEGNLLRIMNRSRFWVRVTYILLVVVAFIGSTKFY